MANRLYTSKDLLRGYVAGKPASYVKTWDFKQFIAFTKAGGPEPKYLKDRLQQAQHDSRIGYALAKYLEQHGPDGQRPKLVGIMGGHGLGRDGAAFKLIADIARDLTQHGYWIVSGGGPGAMEAAHFGAYFAGSTAKAYGSALAQLKTQPSVPDLSAILNTDGSFAPGQEATIKKGYDWITAALSARGKADGGPGISLAVPTWLYGSEPTTPFATVYAKYFQNSIREETLVTQGRSGVLYAQGGGGTLREIFQDVEINYYVRTVEAFTPMIFVDPDGYWQKDATYDAQGKVVTPGVKVDTTIRAIFKRALDPTIREECAKKVEFTTDIHAIRAVLEGHAPRAQRRLGLMLQGSLTSLAYPQWRH